MKTRALKSLIIIIGLVFLSSIAAFAANAASSANEQFVNGLDKTVDGTGHKSIGVFSTKDPATIVGVVVKSILGLMGVLFLGLMIYGGYTWMMARGNEQDVEKAKSIIRNGIIGLAIIFCAYAITATAGKILKSK